MTWIHFVCLVAGLIVGTPLRDFAKPRLHSLVIRLARRRRRRRARGRNEQV